MASPSNKYQEQARDAADRIDRAHDLGRQLTFLGDEVGAPPSETPDRSGNGRPKGAKGKASSQLRAWLASHGYRMPEDQLAQMAGLGSDKGAMVAAMEQVELVLAWAYDDSAQRPTPSQRVAMFSGLYTIMLRAADALMPYGASKASPDVTQNVNVTQVVMPAAPSGPAATVIEGRSSHVGRPPPLPQEIQQNQSLTNPSDAKSDAESRTE